MSNYSLDDFVTDSRAVIGSKLVPAECVEKIVPLMSKLISGDKSFLKAEHFQSDPEHYARNAIYIDDENLMSLYALVWEPGQYTPIHDHGTWGVVGIHEGALEERGFMRIDNQTGPALDNIDLLPGGITLLPPGAVTSFVPNPDHIHYTGNPSSEKRVVSLHLYGNEMAGFHIYDTQTRSREWVEVSHNES